MAQTEFVALYLTFEEYLTGFEMTRMRESDACRVQIAHSCCARALQGRPCTVSLLGAEPGLVRTAVALAERASQD